MTQGIRAITASRITVRVFLISNMLLATAFLVCILLSFRFDDAIAARLLSKYGPAVDAGAVLCAVRLMLACGMVAAVALHRIFAALLMILHAVRDGDPFTAANADRLRTIGWALLALQLFDLALGGFTMWFSELHVDTATWSPALGGWISVLMAFVLASVFRHGSSMRDDLAMTV